MTDERGAGNQIAECQGLPMIVGYVGLGVMGGPIASRLARSETLRVFDHDESAISRLVAEGALASTGLSDLGATCEVVFLCLPTSEQVRQVIFGPDGLASTLPRGAVVVDQTSGDPRVSREIAVELGEMGIGFVDAPVSGGPAGAATGNLAIMVGAEEHDFERVLPLLHEISRNVTRAGSIGSGHVMKLVNNLLSTAQRLLSWEALTLAAKCGVDVQTALEILSNSGGRNAYLEKIMPSVIEGNLDEGFTLALAYKDVSLACALGYESGVPMPFGDLTSERYLRMVQELGGLTRVDRAVGEVEREAGVRLVRGSQAGEGGVGAV